MAAGSRGTVHSTTVGRAPWCCLACIRAAESCTRLPCHSHSPHRNSPSSLDPPPSSLLNTTGGPGEEELAGILLANLLISVPGATAKAIHNQTTISIYSNIAADDSTYSQASTRHRGDSPHLRSLFFSQSAAVDGPSYRLIEYISQVVPLSSALAVEVLCLTKLTWKGVRPACLRLVHLSILGPESALTMYTGLVIYVYGAKLSKKGQSHESAAHSAVIICSTHIKDIQQPPRQAPISVHTGGAQPPQGLKSGTEPSNLESRFRLWLFRVGGVWGLFSSASDLAWRRLTITYQRSRKTQGRRS